MKLAARVAAVALAVLGGAPLALCVWQGSAAASLTTSEQAQIRGFVAGARVENAARVRAFIARPDLSQDEAAQSLTDAVSLVPFNDARQAFFRDMLFGGASEASRSVLVVAAVRSLVARADGLLSKYVTDLDAHPEALVELSRIYAFLGAEIAGAGHPKGLAHDPAAGISSSAYDDAAHVLSDHVQRNPHWLRADALLSSAGTRLRAQLELALYEMLNDTPTRRVDAADRLGLAGARRGFLTELGVLEIDSGKADDARVAKVRAMLDRLPAARAGVEAIYFGEGRPSLRSRGLVVGVQVPLETTQSQAGYDAQPDEVEAGPLDLPLFVLAYELSQVAVKRALDNRGDLRLAVDRDVKAAKDKVPSQLTTEQQLAGVMAQLITDAPRTLDLAFSRWLNDRPETAALVSDALGILAAFAPPSPNGLTLPLGRAKPPSGDSELLPATSVRLLPNGAATSFTLGGHRWELRRSDAGPVEAVRRDGAPVSLSVLPTARVAMTEAPSWAGGGIVFARLVGSPRAGISAGPKIRMSSGGTRGVDVIATPAPGDDVVIDTDFSAHGEAGLVMRASSTRGGFQGASLVFLASDPPKVSLRLGVGGGTEHEVLPASELPNAAEYHVHVTVKGDRLEATVQDAKLAATLPSSLAHGDFGLRVKKGASLEATGLTLKKP